MLYMLSCYYYMFIGVCTQIVNNFCAYMVNGSFINELTFSENKNSTLKGTWNISGSKEKFDNHLLTSLARIPLDKKCTKENIHYYYYMMGRFITTSYYLLNIQDERYCNIIAFHYNNLYTEWQ